jgi:hypothetical protein
MREMEEMTLERALDFERLFKVYTAAPDSIGAHLTDSLLARTAKNEMIVASGADIAVFPGNGRPPSIESFRLNTRGFIELAAISHLGMALAALIRMRQIDPLNAPWRADALRLIERLRAVRALNNEELWRDQICVAAWSDKVGRIAALVDYACVVTTNYLERALADETWMSFEHLRENYLDGTGPDCPPIPFNHVMIATFCLTALDIGHRMSVWLRSKVQDWDRTMVLITGQSGRATAGLTWSTNNLCYLMYRASLRRLDPARVYIAPHAPPLANPEGNPPVWNDLENQYRTLWANTRANVQLAALMFQSYPGFRPEPPHAQWSRAETSRASDTTTSDDISTLIARLRFVLEDPRQLVSNCIADFMIDRLYECGFRPDHVFIPGFSDVVYPVQSSLRP